MKVRDFSEKKLHNLADDGQLRRSTYNVIIPLSSQSTASGKSTYLLFNTLYGNASLISEEEYRILRYFPKINNNAILELANNRYLTTLTEDEEAQVMEERYRSEKKPEDPRAAFVVTYSCNLRCVYCWSHYLFSHEKCNAVIDEKTVDAGFDAMAEIPVLNTAHTLSLYGGEPFLPPTLPIVEYILAKGSKEGYGFHANTNGTYLKSVVPLLSQHTVRGLGVTLDGCEDTHDARRKDVDGNGTFNRIAEGIDAALEERIPIGVRINVDAENFSHLPVFGDWIREHGWANRRDITFTISPVRPSIDQGERPSSLTYFEMAKKIISLMRESPSLLGIMKYEWEYLNEGYLSRTILDGSELRPRPFYCSAHFETFIFDPFGDMYSCPRGVGDQRFCIGRFTPQLQFNEHCSEWLNRDVLSIPSCRGCSIALACGGGCAYEAYRLHHTLYKGYCERYKAFVRYGMPLFVWRRRKADGDNV